MLAEAETRVISDEIVSFETATGAELWRGKPGNVDDAVNGARRAWSAWAAQPLANRIELVRRFVNEVRKQSDNLVTLLAKETGKPRWEAGAEIEAVTNQAEISVRAYAERTAQRKFDSALQGTMAVRHKPHGVVAVIGPANAPAEIPIGHIVPALIAGNAIVFKPSEKAPAIGQALVRCFHRSGISASVVQFLPGGPREGQELVAHEGVDAVLFTGSAHTGITISRRLASRPDKLLSLGMGGNNPIVVWNTPKITDAATIVIQSAFSSAGQRCTSARRLIVNNAMADVLLPELKKLADRLIIGAPFDEPAPFMGPVVDNETADGLTESFLYLLSSGGKAIKHLARPDDSLPFLTPAIIDMTAMKDRPDVELFGPILQVIRVDDLDEAIAEANRTRFGLISTLVGGSPQEYNRFWAGSRAGIVNWNRASTGAVAATPFGGIGLSGNHRPSGYYSADSCAYPVTSAEMEQPRAALGVGLREAS
jgi:succinylglutamic semialdehyde dehydrogenase